MASNSKRFELCCQSFTVSTLGEECMFSHAIKALEPVKDTEENKDIILDDFEDYLRSAEPDKEFKCEHFNVVCY